jgi:hypothetical protein
VTAQNFAHQRSGADLDIPASADDRPTRGVRAALSQPERSVPEKGSRPTDGSRPAAQGVILRNAGTPVP